MEPGLAKSSGMTSSSHLSYIHFGFFDVASTDDNGGAGFRQHSGGLKAKTRVPSGYNGDLPLKITSGQCLFRRCVGAKADPKVSVPSSLASSLTSKVYEDCPKQ